MLHEMTVAEERADIYRKRVCDAAEQAAMNAFGRALDAAIENLRDCKRALRLQHCHADDRARDNVQGIGESVLQMLLDDPPLPYINAVTEADYFEHISDADCLADRVREAVERIIKGVAKSH